MDEKSYLQGKTAWVTGSSRGIGRTIAHELAVAGCSVVLHGRNRTNLQSSGEGTDLELVAWEMAEETGSQVIAVCGELTKEAVVKECVRQILGQLGSLDILVCNAGGSNLSSELCLNLEKASASIFELTDFRRRLDHNLLPTVLCCREIVPLMRQNTWGRILTVGSIAGCGGNKTEGRTHLPYSLAKNAVMQYTRLLAAELRHDGIPVNCLIPGNINTPSTRLRFGGERDKPNPELSRLEAVGKAEDLAYLARFLCGPGGEYISGQGIRVDGGEQLSPC